MKSATRRKSASVKPRVVSAGEPMRTPPGTTADLSPGTLFLFSVMAAMSSTCTRWQANTWEAGLGECVIACSAGFR